ncbi:hypothetical protein PSQ90_06625 [Devosia rhodophyticola]|uniref:Glycosyltransferase RgtA/B/C/D-like domain-containing protein n=1 Tax=Devosia rhodophyticola TaxID=3026423 RepID=A0ABY7Z0D2_9HYPH|nr:hypothetical protein [Devosia rhodophyticola]WDR07103.1 hypothetical protein PSQ90_06625 [Devosia rhodophyticola]
MTDKSSAGRINPVLVLAIFGIAVATLVIRAIVGGGHGPLFADTDDAMRMVVVRDFLGGQNWFDIVQHRLNAPFGAEVHWSRLVDLPIATIIVVARPFAFGHAELVAAYVWPLLLLLILLWLSARLALRLVGEVGVLPALILPVLSPAVTAEFTPGRIDHHSVQIILTLAIAWACIEAIKRWRFSMLAGGLCATALAVGTESVPAVIVAIAGTALLWVFRTDQSKNLRGFGISFAVVGIVHLVIALPPERWFVPACDAISIFYIGGALLIGVLFGALGSASWLQSSYWRKLIGMVVAGVIGIGLTLLIDPQCIKGPYASVDPWLVANWLNAISEAKTWWESIWELPAYTIAVSVPGFVGIAIIAWRAIRFPYDRSEWLVLMGFLAMATLVMALQVRGARLVTMPAIPAAAWLIVTLRKRYLDGRRLRDAALLLGSWLTFSGIIMVVLVTLLTGGLALPSNNTAIEQPGRASCVVPEAFVQLGTLPAQPIMNPIDLGSHILLNTSHSVVAAPYHRNEQGVLDAFHFFNQPISTARDILDKRGINLVVTCPALPEMAGLPDAAPDSFVKLAPEGRLPAWLTDISKGGPLKIYVVAPR